MSTDRINLIQKRAVGNINQLDYNSHAQQYFEFMEIFKINDHYLLCILSQVFKYHKNVGIALNSDFHSHITRNRNQMSVPRYNKTKSQSCWMYQGIANWNSLPSSIKEAPSIFVFKKRLKNYLLSSRT